MLAREKIENILYVRLLEKKQNNHNIKRLNSIRMWCKTPYLHPPIMCTALDFLKENTKD